jgi:cell division protein FtsN
MFYTYWIPMETDFIDTGKIQFADFNPIRKAPERTYQLRHDEIAFPTIETLKSWEDVTANLSDNVKIYNYQFDDQLYIPIRLDKTATAVSAEIDERTNQSAAAVSEGSNYHVIGGCFSIKENAEKLAADMRSKGFQASIFDLKGGLYRVSVGDYSTSELAEQKLGEFTAQGFSGWILNK